MVDVKPANLLLTALKTVPIAVMVFVSLVVEKMYSLAKSIVEPVAIDCVKSHMKVHMFVLKIVVIVAMMSVMSTSEKMLKLVRLIAVCLFVVMEDAQVVKLLRNARGIVPLLLKMFTLPKSTWISPVLFQE